MQPHVLETFGPVDSTKPTKKQSAEAVTSLMLPNDNLNGDIYGRACVEVRKHRDKIKNEDTASPTVATESVFITASVDAH